VRSRPIIEWLIFSVFWLLLSVPLLKITGSRTKSDIHEQAAASSVDTTEQIPAIIIVRYTGTPEFFRLSQMERVLFEAHEPADELMEQRVALTIESGIAEILLQAEWDDNQRHVLEIEALIEGHEEKRLHCWATHELDEVITLNWNFRNNTNANDNP